MKKTVLAVVCVILIFIPTFVAIASYVMTQNAPILNNYVEKIEISDLDGNVSTVTKTKNKGDFVSFFVSMNNAATKVNELPDPLVGTAFYKVVFYSGNVAEEYKYYFDTTGASSYAEYPDGSIYQLKNDDVNKFLITPYALSLFSDDEMPVLRTPSGDKIVPSKVSWNYKLGSDYSALSGFKTTDELVNYTMDGSVQLLFSSDADLYTIKVYDSTSALVYDGSTDDLSTLTLGDGGELTFMVTASWYKDDTRNFYGEASYNFKTTLVAGAEFFIGTSSIDPGEFVAITAYNVSDPSRIKFSSEPSIGFTPTFYMDGDHAVGLVPISAELEAKSYVFTLSYGAMKQDINLTINNKTFKKRTQNISKIVAENTRSEEALKAFDEVFAEICAKSETTKYFSGNFIDMSSGDGNIKAAIIAGFGIYRTITSTDETYRSNGVEFRVANGTDIPACNSGKVVYTGITTFGGRMVVVDHGLGLKTWYMHLSEVKVNVDDTVAKGETVGTAGTSGFTETPGVFTIMTVGDMPVCPYDTWENGVLMYEKH